MRVLLIEDDPDTAESIALMLRAEKFVVDTTEFGEDGLEIGKLYDYDIILLDLVLPDIDGYEVLRRLRTGGQQFVRVEHVHVNDCGQAVIGNVKTENAKE